ncbi:hypothetical protein PF004_g28753 [Phytophthora fragariae]|uniref:Uncharacterized protein n=1 Tax=Phytophthora fragariae TaxID=53985 RepID=A0A6G0MHP8_9STRA|nr:hypothetical protein PF004_g28753 [Phytophthora fragariae]
MRLGTVITLASAAVGLASAEVWVPVQNDAVYSLPDGRGQPCSGTGAMPLGLECPRKGDMAVSDCHSALETFDGTNCVAMVDAECAMIARSQWGHIDKCALGNHGAPP